MPEKTLKESDSAKASTDKKVERASLDLSGIEVHYPHIDLFNIQEALTALEDRVKELESENRSLLQRAREALTWIPVSERLPEKSGLFAVSGRDMQESR